MNNGHTTAAPPGAFAMIADVRQPLGVKKYVAAIKIINQLHKIKH